MASAGLKRPSDFDLNSPPHSSSNPNLPLWSANKRRCTSFAIQQPASIMSPSGSSTSPSAHYHHNLHQHPSTLGGASPTVSSSLFKEPNLLLNSLSDDVSSMIKNEVHRAHPNHHHQHHHHQVHQQQQHHHQNHPQHQHHQSQMGSLADNNDQPLLTIRQTQLICEKLIREREQKLREEYDKILISKLAEQYDTFVKYTHDHIEKRYNDTNSHQASYLS